MEQQGYKKLIVWQKSIVITKAIYEITKQFPKDEQFGLVSQMRRAVVSIPSNLAEGSRRRTQKDKNHFYSIAFGSASELETQIEIVYELGFIDQETYKDLILQIEEVLRMLNKLTSY
ncbi:MAG TPA: four helix bundle protein [Candidatus Paceibacterota bacterium]|nr:four helix bundle protein [Candidatus Paceibacterota bacterium]